MVNMFPYSLVPKGSRIVLYGAGTIGKDFFLQVHALQDYYRLEAWVDRVFDSYTVRSPFDYVRNIVNHDFDYIIVAIGVEKTAHAIIQWLKEQGIPESKIIWSLQHYYISNECLPGNKVLSLENYDFYMGLLDDYWSASASSTFGLSRFYQNYKELGFSGGRNTEERIVFYHINEFLTSNDIVLDIGCNCGFLDMQIAPYVKKVVGYEIEPKFVEIAKKTSKFMHIDNTEFHCENFVLSNHKHKYNAVFSFAVHRHLLKSGFSKEEFVNCMYELLLDNGFIFFESHDINYDADLYHELVNLFKEKNMKVKLYQNYQSGTDRDITILQKK